ncbi:hypothetical protein OG923_23810 [Streptomyces halstedii]|uniref:hypothetical protein n=1 Tax=Streptomyces halstedii TaxID=1944 RepID=UPI00324892EF
MPVTPVVTEHGHERTEPATGDEPALHQGRTAPSTAQASSPPGVRGGRHDCAESGRATWSADLSDQADIDAVTADVRASLAADIERARRAFLDSAPPGELDADPIGAAAVLAFSALRAAGAALPEFRSSALGRLGQTEEADAEARRAYKTEQRRRWFRHNPNGADAVAAATKAADTARNALPSTCSRPG